MKRSKLYLIALFVLISSAVIGQEFKKKDIQLEKSMYNVHIGLINTSISNESRLTDKISLKSELILHIGYFYNESFRINDFGLLPSINIEPRYYHNRKRRAFLNKDLHNNAGNYIGLSIEYIQGKALFNHYFNQFASLSITPVYGLKRNFTNRSRFNYELGGGITMKNTLLKNYGFNKDYIDWNIYLRIGVGYRL